MSKFDIGRHMKTKTPAGNNMYLTLKPDEIEVLAELGKLYPYTSRTRLLREAFRRGAPVLVKEAKEKVT